MKELPLITYLMDRHWLMMNGDLTIRGCHCGFQADEEQDSGYGDSVVRHLFIVAQASE